MADPSRGRTPHHQFARRCDRQRAPARLPGRCHDPGQRRQRVRRRRCRRSRAERGRAVHVRPRRHGFRHCLGRRGTARARAGLRAPHPALLPRRPLHHARGAGPWPALGRPPRQPRRLVHDAGTATAPCHSPGCWRPPPTWAERGFGVGRFGVEEFNDYAPGHAQASYGAAFQDNYTVWQGVQPGTVIRQPHLAATLRHIGETGPSLLYGGPLGERVAAHVASLGGTLILDDLADVQAVLARAGLRILPRAAGARPAAALRGFPVPADARHPGRVRSRVTRPQYGGASGPGHPRHPPRRHGAHRQQRPGRRGAGSAVQPVGGHAAGPAARRRRPARADRAVRWPRPPAGEDPGHTTSFSIADAEGNLVCVTQSLGSPFGSGVVVPGTGICLNNFLYWADVQPGSPNCAGPGHPLPMCMSPSVSTRDGVPELALGTPRQLRHPADTGTGHGQPARVRPAVAGRDRGAARPPLGRQPDRIGEPHRSVRDRGAPHPRARCTAVPDTPGRCASAACRPSGATRRPAC